MKPPSASGTNDTNPARLRDNFAAILDLLAEAGVQPVLVLEANSIERLPTDSQHGDLSVKHRILSDLAVMRGIPVFDIHEHLASHRNTGFLWWDFSHLTSFGQRLLAEYLEARLPAAFGLR